MKKSFVLLIVIVGLFSLPVFLFSQDEAGIEVLKITAFPAPSNLTLTATSDQSIALNWIDNCSFEEGYEVWRKNDNGTYEIIDSTAANISVYTDTALTYGTSYSYKVRAFTSINSSGYSNADVTTTTFPAPSHLTARATSDQSITLNWIDNCSFEEGFEIWRKNDNGTYEIIDSTAANITAYADTALTYGTSYSYKVRAFTKLNSSNYSDTFPAPSNLIARATSDQTIALSWNDNCSFEAGYEVWRKIGNGTYEILDSTAANISGYENSGLTYGTSYSYKVRAFTVMNLSNYSGLTYGDSYAKIVLAFTNLSTSEFSNSDMTNTMFPAPSNLIARATSDQSIALNWIDNCSFEEGFEVWRKIGNGTYEIIDSTDSNISGYEDSGLTYGESYSYKLRAFTNLNTSGYSNAYMSNTMFPAPSNFSATALSDQSISLSWNDNCNYEEGYEIWRKIGNGIYEIIDSTEANVTSYSNDDVVPVIKLVESEETFSIDVGYRGLPWGATSGYTYNYRIRAFTKLNSSKYVSSGLTYAEFKNFVQFDDSSASFGEREISFIGPLGEDTVRFVYSFSDSGFWKVTSDFTLKGNTIEDYLKEFHRIENLLTKKYGNPERTTRNDLGTSREYISSPFPRLFRGYYRSSWKIDNVNIELLLEVKMQDSEYDSPVFSDNIPTMRLYYYNSEFYGFAEPEPIEIPEDELLEQF